MITIIIRAFNEAENLRKCLNLLKEQSLQNKVIVVDSDSEDDTALVALAMGACVVQCSNFTYGKGINVGIAAAHTEKICILSAHCFPTNHNFLLSMLRCMDGDVAGVYARQIPPEDATALDKRNLALIYPKSSKPVEDFTRFNNAASMIARSIWQQVKFDETVEACEDLVWAKAVTGMGYKIIYQPLAVVEHYHDDDFDTICKRYGKEYEVIQEL